MAYSFVAIAYSEVYNIISNIIHHNVRPTDKVHYMITPLEMGSVLTNFMHNQLISRNFWKIQLVPFSCDVNTNLLDGVAITLFCGLHHALDLISVPNQTLICNMYRYSNVIYCCQAPLERPWSCDDDPSDDDDEEASSTLPFWLKEPSNYRTCCTTTSIRYSTIQR